MVTLLENAFGGKGETGGMTPATGSPRLMEKIWIARGLPSSLMVKSSFERSSTIRPRESLATTSICTTRVSDRSVGTVCAAAEWKKTTAIAAHRIPAITLS